MGACGGIPILKIAVLRYSEASTQEARGMSKVRQGDAGPLSTEQVARLEELLLASGYLSQEKARELLHWFLHELGIDPYYFSVTTVEEIASHLLAIGASRLAAQAGGAAVGVELKNEREDRAVYIVEEEPVRTNEIEKRIEARYPLWRLESYMAKEKGRPFLRLYILNRPDYGPPLASGEAPGFERAADCLFLDRSAQATKERYRAMWELMNEREVPVVSVTDKAESGETRIMIGIHSGRSQNFLNLFSNLFDQYHLHSNRKHREIFSDNKKIYSLYFDRLEPRTAEAFSRDLLGVIMLPQHPLTSLFTNGTYLPQQTLYALAGASYTHQFLTMLTEEYATVAEALRDQPEVRGIVDRWKRSLTKNTFSEDVITAAVTANTGIINLLYEHFCARLDPVRKADGKGPAGGLEALERRIQEELEREVAGESERTILRTFLTFNQAVLRTNFHPEQALPVLQAGPRGGAGTGVSGPALRGLLLRGPRVHRLPSPLPGYRPRRHPHREVRQPRRVRAQPGHHLSGELQPGPHPAAQEQGHPGRRGQGHAAAAAAQPGRGARGLRQLHRRAAGPAAAPQGRAGPGGPAGHPVPGP
jgi:hypothetical protein